MVVTGAWLVNVPTLTNMVIPENSKSKSCLQHPPEGSCCDFQPRSAQDIPHGILHSGQQAMLSVSPFSAQANTLVRRSPACVPGANGLNGATDRGLTTDQPSPRDQLILTIQLVTLFFHALPFASSQFQSCRTNTTVIPLSLIRPNTSRTAAAQIVFPRVSFSFSFFCSKQQSCAECCCQTVH